MNHAVTARAVDSHVAEYNTILAQNPSDPAPPMIFGETNSLYNQGRPGLSNTFGAALWGVDFNLYAASVGFKRVHMHMGTNYRVNLPSPRQTPKLTTTVYLPIVRRLAARPNLPRHPGHQSPLLRLHSRRRRPRPPPRHRRLPPPSLLPGPLLRLCNLHLVRHPPHPPYVERDLFPSSFRVLYQQPSNLAIYLTVVILNLLSYNTTLDGAGLVPLPPSSIPPRGQVEYTLHLEGVSPGRVVGIRRLMANGSDAITGITFDGWSYNYELDQGRPVRLGNVTVGERVVVQEGGVVTVRVGDASGVVLDVGGVDGDFGGVGGEGCEDGEKVGL